MKRIVHPANPPNSQPKAPATTPVVDPPKVSDIDISGLIDDGLLALYREIKNILMVSSRGKLDAATARDLRDHLKLLFELKDREKDWLKSLTPEQLDDLMKQIEAEKATHDPNQD